MAYKTNSDFHRDYPNGYEKGGTVYDGNHNSIGYRTGDGDYRINDGSCFDRQLYHNSK